MTYQETIDYLYNTLPIFQNIGGAAFNRGLTKTVKLLDALDNPQHSFKSIHIAGTNGKGSVSSMLAAVLQSSGYKTGLYTSPHLKRFTERIRVNGIEMPEKDVIRFVEKTKSLIEIIQPSFFEVTVAMAFEHFANEGVDVAIVEVGMGGRLDSTNVITPELSVITNISFDHQAFLGDTLPEIAAEKAGIIKPNVPVIVSEYDEKTATVFNSHARNNHSEILFASQVYSITKQDSGSLNVDKGNQRQYSDLQCQLKGNYQLKNIPAVIASLDKLKDIGFNLINTKSIEDGLANVCDLTGLKGRWQKLSNSPLTICDTGHNEAGIRNVLEHLQSYSYKKLHIVFGMVKDKDISRVLSILPTDARYYFCQPSIPRGLDAEALKLTADKFSLIGEAIPDVNDALSQARKCADSDDFIFIGGSTFVVADLKEL